MVPPTNSLAPWLQDIHVKQNLVGWHGIMFPINTNGRSIYSHRSILWLIDWPDFPLTCAHWVPSVQWHNELNTLLVSTFHSQFTLVYTPDRARSVWRLNQFMLSVGNLCCQGVVTVCTTLISSQSLISYTSKYKRISRPVDCTVTQFLPTISAFCEISLHKYTNITDISPGHAPARTIGWRHTQWEKS